MGIFMDWLTRDPPPDEPITFRGVEWNVNGTMRSCIFCEYAAQTKEKELVFQDDLIVAFRPPKKAAKQHLLILPRRHISTIGDLISGDTVMMDRMKAVALELLKCEDASNVQLSFHVPPWNSIDHLHLHAIEKPFVSRWQSLRFSEGKPWCAAFEKVREWAAGAGIEEGRIPLSREEA
eukprot:jgi/Undpi1/6074/HiC_scaffold_20.g08559.m1